MCSGVAERPTQFSLRSHSQPFKTMNDLNQSLINLLCAIPALVAGLTIHEFAHAWAAHKLGDDTAKRQGRLTLDPLAHLDPIGSIFIVLAAFVGFFIGWAKPVPVDRRNFAHPRRDDALVAIAGPISNLLQVPFWLASVVASFFLATKFGWYEGPNAPIFEMVSRALTYGVIVNIALAAFNMIPIPPLDGHWILAALGGPPVEAVFDQIRPFSFVILIVLINIPGVAEAVIGPAYHGAFQLLGWAQDLGVQLAL